MRQIVFVISLIISGINIFGQVHIDSIPDVTLQDLLRRKCSYDTVADAEVLYDIGYAYFEKTDRMRYVLRRKRRVQVFNKSGYDNGEVYIPYYTGRNYKEKLVNFQAVVYNVVDGKIEKQYFDKSVLYEQKINEWSSVKKFAFPNLKEGSIIEYSYKLLSPFVEIIDPWYFQEDIPVQQNYFSIQFPPNYQYIFLKSGDSIFDYEHVSSGYRCIINGSHSPEAKIYEWGMKDVPAFKRESFMTTDKDYLFQIQFQLKRYGDEYGNNHKYIESWKIFNYKLIRESESFGLYVNAKKRNAKEILKTLNLDGLSKHEKAIRIDRYVKDNYIWDEEYGIYSSVTKSELQKTKTANVAGINLFLLSLLKAGDIEAYPVILSTRTHGLPYVAYPLVRQYNYVIVLVKDEKGEFLLDATDPLLPFGLIPEECTNGVGVQINKLKKGEDPVLISLVPKQMNGAITVSMLQLDMENNVMKVMQRVSSVAYDAKRLRKKLEEEGENELINYILGTDDIEVDSVEIFHSEDVEENFVVKFYFSFPYTYFGGDFVIDPFVFKQYKIPLFKKEERHYRVNFTYKNRDVFNTVIQIPEGYEIDTFPKDTTLMNNDGKFFFNYHSSNTGKSLQIHAEIYRNEVIFPVSDYPELKSFYESISEKFNEKIVLKRIE